MEVDTLCGASNLHLRGAAMRTEETAVTNGNHSPEFIMQSIVDLQGTIRAIDMKLQILIATLIVPIAALECIAKAIHTLWDSCLVADSCIWDAVVVAALYLLFISWIAALFFSIRGLVAVHDPRAHVSGDGLPTGCFYAGHLFETDLRDAFCDRSALKSTETLSAFLACHPTSPEAVNRELVFEKMKLAYIRQVKLCRQKWAFGALSAWALSLSLVTLLYCCR